MRLLETPTPKKSGYKATSIFNRTTIFYEPKLTAFSLLSDISDNPSREWNCCVRGQDLENFSDLTENYYLTLAYSNFNFSNNAWFVDNKPLGFSFNWAWRPYFNEAFSFQTNNPIVTSEC